MRIHRRDAETQSQEEERVNREPHEIYEPRERRQNGRWLWTKWTEPESKASAECTRWRVRSHSHRRFGFWSVRLYANLFAYMRTFWRILKKNIFSRRCGRRLRAHNGWGMCQKWSGGVLEY